MNVIATELPGVLIIEPKVFGDERGFFMRASMPARLKKPAGYNCSLCRIITRARKKAC